MPVPTSPASGYEAPDGHAPAALLTHAKQSSLILPRDSQLQCIAVDLESTYLLASSVRRHIAALDLDRKGARPIIDGVRTIVGGECGECRLEFRRGRRTGSREPLHRRSPHHLDERVAGCVKHRVARDGISEGSRDPTPIVPYFVSYAPPSANQVVGVRHGSSRGERGASGEEEAEQQKSTHRSRGNGRPTEQLQGQRALTGSSVSDEMAGATSRASSVRSDTAWKRNS